MQTTSEEQAVCTASVGNSEVCLNTLSPTPQNLQLALISLENLHPRHVEVSPCAEVLVCSKCSVPVLDELGATIVFRVGFQQRVHSSATRSWTMHGVASSRHTPDLAGPIPAKADVEDELLRSHNICRVAAIWFSSSAERVVAHKPLVPRVRLGVILQQVGGQLVIWNLEDFDETFCPLDCEGHWVHVPLGGALQGQSVWCATELLWVVCGAIIIHAVQVRHHRAARFVDLSAIQVACIPNTGVERGLRGNVVHVLQDIQLTTFRPLDATCMRPEGGPQTTTKRHMREANGCEEILPRPPGANLGGLALARKAPGTHAQDSMRIVGSSYTFRVCLVAAKVLGSAIVRIPLEVIPVVEEGTSARKPI
mmetsp:Transcript_91214/g.229299  ORF Transcript_91214/g.229299 Transcript_91214/m.229299 type:complete len:366 (+) Transcript_91214:283-1380(+)